MLTRTARRGMPAAVLLAVSLALTACGPDDASSSSGDPSATQGANDQANNEAAGSGSAASSGSSGKAGSGRTTSEAGSVPACATSRLKTTAGNIDGAAGHAHFQIDFQNTGGTPCTLTGYPGVSFVKAHNVQLGKAASRTAGSTRTVTLIPNGHAYADTQTVNGQGGYTDDECQLTSVPTLRVYPPNQKESTNIPWNKDECVGSAIQNLRVGPVHSTR